ncbi:hypothetical protein ACET3Z_027467 [Daucus carota]
MDPIGEVVQGDTCYCERLAVHSTYRGTGPNAGRMMSRCPLWLEGCGYMFWIDDPLEARATAVLTQMTKEMSDLIWDHHFAKERIRERHDEDLKSVKGKEKKKGEAFMDSVVVDKCYCDKVLVKRVCHDNGPDVGRRMLQCPNDNGCGYLVWLDERLDTRATVVINKLSEEISDLKWSQAVEIAEMETKHAERVKKLKKTMKGDGSRWDAEDV